MSNEPVPDLNMLAMEALDLWQDHLAKLAADPKAKAELAQLMEPQRRMFAEWMQKAQTAPHGESFTPTAAESDSAPRPATAGAASDDGTLRIAQLAIHVVELEKRVAKLESRAGSRRSAAKAKNPS